MQDSVQSTQSAFLLLPLHIREEIYSWAGLVRNCPIDVKEERNRWNTIASAFSKYFSEDIVSLNLKEWHDRGGSSMCAYHKKKKYPRDVHMGEECAHPSLPIHIFTINRQVHQEAEYLFYSRNNFLVESTTLFTLPKRSLPWLKLLQVRLTSCSCVAGHKCRRLYVHQNFNDCVNCHYCCKRGNGNPFAIEDTQDKHTLIQWTAMCSLLAEKCSPQLQLTLICDCSDSQTATKVVKPLRAFPKLQHASIRLGQTPGTDLGTLAETTVLQLIGVPRTVFPFQQLPTELKELVLSYTDLRAPDYISWNEPVDGRHMVDHDEITGCLAYGFRISHDGLRTCCLNCTSSREVCACFVRHAAYSSKACTCWSSPTALFLINKEFGKLARKIFLSQNRFTLWEYLDKTDSVPVIASPINILQQMPQDWASNIRWLQFIWKDLECLAGWEEDQWSWRMLPTLLKAWPAIEQLTIEINLAYRKDTSLQPDWSVVPSELIMTEPLFRRLATLFKLDGDQHYKDFFFRFVHTVESSEDNWRLWRLEKELERMVMGSKDYDAVQRGKYRN